MVLEMAAITVLRRPDRVLEAHAVAMHGLDVLSRNGSRPPSRVRRLGPLTGIAAYLVQQVIRYVVRRHQHQVIEAVGDLYARRLGWVPPGDPSRTVLLRARRDIERAAPAEERGGRIPGRRRRGRLRRLPPDRGLVLGDPPGRGHRRRRIKLSLDRPLAALWETIGWCGRPPHDTSSMVAAIAIALTVAGWLLIPIGLFLVFALF